MDHSVASVLGAPDSNCSSSCQVGGAAPGSPAQGGHYVATSDGGVITASGTIPVVNPPGSEGLVGGTGHVTQTAPFPVATISGNFNTIPSSKGRCTGAATDLCS